MTCYAPIPAYRTDAGDVVFSEKRRHGATSRFDVACGQCLGCRLRRSRDWSVRVMHEASQWKDNCFVTLTYGRDKLPEGGSLCYRDFQLFMMRLRWDIYPRRVRFFMCGEYGSATFRPHYHACLFNVNFADRVVGGTSGSGNVWFKSERLKKLWTHGIVSVQDLTPQTAAYCARYIMKKVTGDLAENYYGDLVPEFSRCSLKPGIGSAWFERYGRNVYAIDGCIVDGDKLAPPRYYDKLKKKVGYWDNDDGDLQLAREKRRKAAFADNSDERLVVRRLVQESKLVRLKRTYDG